MLIIAVMDCYTPCRSVIFLICLFKNEAARFLSKNQRVPKHTIFEEPALKLFYVVRSSCSPNTVDSQTGHQGCRKHQDAEGHFPARKRLNKAIEDVYLGSYPFSLVL